MRHTKTPLHTFPKSMKFAQCHIDLVGPLLNSHGRTYLFAACDSFSRWIKAVPICDISPDSIARTFFETWVSRYGIPNVVTSDHGTQFTSDLHHGLTQLLGAKHIMTTTYHSQANGQIERWHRRIKESLRCFGGKWTDALPGVLLGLQTAIDDSGTALAIATFGCALRLPGTLFDEPELVNEDVASYATTLVDCLNRIRPSPHDWYTNE